MKIPGIIFSILFACILFAFGIYVFRFFKTVYPSDKQIVVNLSCNRGYEMKARYYKPDENGILTQLSLTVKKDDQSVVYDMATTLSGSGSKFETQNKRFSFWEHQGEFTFAIDNRDTSVCTDKNLTSTPQSNQ